LSGLARAFFYAGARALLVSHWPVDDRATASIASNLFASLNADAQLGRAEALQRAMISFLSDSDHVENAFPGLWGPFIVVGEGRR
jgi:CHAT domain-containing protein